MITLAYTRQSGKYTLLLESIGKWCESAKISNSFVIATPMGIYKMKFCGEFKPKTARYKIRVETS